MKRRLDIDIAKGFGIILVVWAHAAGPFTNLIYAFHMPLFFLISGLLHSSRRTLKDFIQRKVKSLYLPFVIWNLVFYSFEHRVVEGDSLSELLHGSKLIVLTLSKEGRWLNASWFLGALFVISILYKILETVIQPDNKQKDVLIFLSFTSLAILGFEITFPYLLSRTFVLGFFYALGALLKKYREKLTLQSNKKTASLAFVFFLLFAAFNHINMGKNSYDSQMVFMIGALLGSYVLLYVSKLLAQDVPKVVEIFRNHIAYIGLNSMGIVLWQFVAFKGIVFLHLLSRGQYEGWKQVAHYYSIVSPRNGWWLLYTLAGVYLSILFEKFLKVGPWGSLLKKIHAV